MAGSDKEFCIKCDKGGKVLSCSDSSCPISVHEKCLGFPAKFDDLGNFYCPYCSYRRATEESRLAWEKALLRKKALSSFIDTEMINGDEHMHEVGKSEQKELGRLHNTGKGNCSLGSGNENKLDQAVFQKHPIQPQEEREEDEIAPENAWGVSVHKEINTLLLGKKNNELSSKSGDNASSSKWNDRLVVVGHQTPSGPIVACGQDVSSEEEGIEQHFEMVEIRRWSQLEHHKQPYNVEVEETVENHTEDTNFSDIPLEENQQRENYFSSSAKDVDNEGNPIEEDNDHIDGKEDPEEQVPISISSLATEPATPVALEEKEGFESADILCRGANLTSPSKHVKHDKRSGHPSDVSCSKRSYQLSPSAPRANVEHIEEQTIHTELKQVAEPSSVSVQFPSVRRKKLQWKGDEEEMLREGFQKYSSTGNKNIPWRKILQFGRQSALDKAVSAGQGITSYKMLVNLCSENTSSLSEIDLRPPAMDCILKLLHEDYLCLGCDKEFINSLQSSWHLFPQARIFTFLEIKEIIFGLSARKDPGGAEPSLVANVNDCLVWI